MLAIGSPHTAQRIAALTHLEPELLMTAGSDEPVGAVWSHAPVLAEVSGLPHHAIALHLGGSTLVEKWRCWRAIRAWRICMSIRSS
jgi:hypothetical protein